MKIFMVLGGEKTKPIQSQTNPIYLAPRPALGVLKKQNQSRPSAGNPKHEIRNSKQDERMRNDRVRFEKTKPILGKGKSKKVKGKIRINPELLQIGDLKKQSQFLKGHNERKCIYERVL